MKLALISINDEGSFRIGMVNLATFLKVHGNYDNIKIFEYNRQDIISELKKFQPDLIGIGAMTIEYMRAQRLAKLIKEEDPNTPIILGGVHISEIPASFVSLFDIGVIGEAEEIFLELVNLYDKKHKFDFDNLKDVKGIIYFKDKQLKINEPRPYIHDLSIIPIPDYKSFVAKVHFEKKRRFIGGFEREIAILSSRGCPFRCIFCSTTKFWKKFRFLPYEQVVEEITLLHDDFKVNRIGFWDDLFVAKADRIENIRKMLKQNGVLDDLKIAVQSRANLVNDKHFEMLKTLNTEAVSFGFESGSDRYLRYLKCGSIGIKDNLRTVDLAKKHKMPIFGSLIMGGPTETIKEMEKTIKFIKYAKKRNIKYLWSFVMTPFPGTDMWEIAKQRGKVSTHMDFDVLSHQSLDNPLLLDPDIPKSTFKDIFLKARKELDFVKYNMIKNNLILSPFETFKDFASKPYYYLNMIIRKTTKYGNPLDNIDGNEFNAF